MKKWVSRIVKTYDKQLKGAISQASDNNRNYHWTLTIRLTNCDMQHSWVITLVDTSQPISRVLSGTVIHLGHISLYASSNLPVFNASNALTSSQGLEERTPIWSCSEWGLPCRSYRTISPLLLSIKRHNPT